MGLPKHLSSDRDRALEEAIAKAIAEHGELRPLWIEHPEIPDGSIGWRMGGGEHYAMMFGRWWSRVPHEERIAYFERHRPIPIAWAAHVASMLFADELEHIDDAWDPPVERLVELGWIDEAAWRAWCSGAIGREPASR